MKYGSVCSGIEAATVAWHPLGWKPLFFSEIEPFPSAVLAHHYPSVPNLGDFTQIGEEYCGAIDLLVGGTPCQSFSVAGRRAGLDDPRGNLAIEFIKLAQRLRPRWLVWENVPGVLSSWSDAEEEGWETNDFDTFLSFLGQCGYGFAWRILDAQYFGVPQRRRRVFVVGHLGDWRSAAAVLFERDSLQRHPAPCREAGADVAATLKGSTGNRGFSLDNETGLALASNDGHRHDPTADTFIPCAVKIDNTTSNGWGVLEDGTTHTLGGSQDAVLCFQERTRNGDRHLDYQQDLAYSLNNPGNGGRSQERNVCHNMVVRRLTPRECERLQGFPDDFTLVPFNGRPASDAQRDRALGNSMAVPVMRWIGRRIDQVDSLIQEVVA